MRQKLTVKNPKTDKSPSNHQRNSSQNQCFQGNYLQQKPFNMENSVFDEDKQEEGEEQNKFQEVDLVMKNSRQIQLQDKQSNIKKHQSESDFLERESIKRNQSLFNGNKINRIQLIVRIRPFLSTEQIKECLKVVNEQGIRLFKEYHQIHFKFDTILMPKDPQNQVFSQVQRINGTIFAYGQTGAGKTYSIIGGENSKGNEILYSQKKGILPRTLDFIFQKLNEQNSQMKLSISFYEIYNEKIVDLICQDKKKKSKGKDYLELREEKNGYFTIADLKRYPVQNIKEAYQYLEQGLYRRITNSTSMNNQSSRSHSIFELYLEKESQEGVKIRSKLRIVDLAGSEKYTIKKDLPVAEKNLKVQELTSINSSLSALGQCISALADHSRKHIPYRNSKLTKVLKDSLDESSQVALIICISPSIDSYKETFSTLQFADRAKKAILDGRHFSDSKLINDKIHQSGVNDILKAYQEEQAIRRELEKHMKENNQVDVLYELQELKKQNEELQSKVKQLESNKQVIKQKGCLKESSENIDEKLKIKKPENQVKNVKFAEKLDNDDSIDSEMRERIEHNLKYNDDTIFDNISIFRDVNNSGLVINKKIVDHEKHPLKMKNRLFLEEEEDEEEEEEEKEEEKKNNNNDNQEQDQDQDSVIQKQNVEDNKNKSNDQQDIELRDLLEKAVDKNEKEFWEEPASDQQQRQNDGVSPILKKRPNNSSQDFSKDLIELNEEKDSPFTKRIHMQNLGDKTLGSNKPKQQQQQIQSTFKNNFVQEELQQSLGDLVEEEKDDIEFQEQSNDDQEAKDYHVFDNSEQFFQPDFTDNQECGAEQMLSDTLQIDGGDEVEAGNCSQDNQNTLMLDSQSMIIEAGDINTQEVKDPNISQQLQQLEASSILQNKEQSAQYQTNQYSMAFQSSSNANSSNHNTDVLTYSLTNTFSTIESLHDELKSIQAGIELSQRKDGNILRTIHRYAREIEENKISDEEENVKSVDDISIDKDITDIGDENDNANFVNDIKGYYNKIHNEISQLKGILLETSKVQQNQFPLKKHMISEKVPQKPSQFNSKQYFSYQIINKDAIEKTQSLINDIKQEMNEILFNNTKDKKQNKKKGSSKKFEDKNTHQSDKAKRSMKVLELLELLQSYLLQSVSLYKRFKCSQVSQQQQNFQDTKQYQTPYFVQQDNNNSSKQKKQVQGNKNNAKKFLDQDIRRNSFEYQQHRKTQKHQERNSPRQNDKQQDSQKTPEIFKSLAKLDEQGLQPQNKKNLVINQEDYVSKKENQSTNKKEPIKQVNSDLQLTLRSKSQQKYEENKVPTKTEKKKEDNTLTLIFDSDDEPEQNNSSQKVKIEDENDEGEEVEEQSLFDEENSKIERGSSAQRQISNSFQGDSSILMLANHLNMKDLYQAKNKNKNNQKRSQSINSRNSNSECLSEIYDNMEDQIIRTVKRKEFFNQYSQQKKLQNENNALDFTESAIVNNNDESSITSKQSVLKYWNQFFNKEANTSTKKNKFNSNSKTNYFSNARNEEFTDTPYRKQQ